MTALTAEAPAPTACRRSEERPENRGAVFCWRGLNATGSLGVALRADSLDVSLGGARLSAPRTFAVGESLELEFLNRDGERAVHRASAQVRWVREDGPGRWQVGCQFAQPMSLKQQLELLR